MASSGRLHCPMFLPNSDSCAITPKISAERTPVLFEAKFAYSSAFSKEIAGEPCNKKSWLRIEAAAFCLSPKIFRYSDSLPLVIFKRFCLARSSASKFFRSSSTSVRNSTSSLRSRSNPARAVSSSCFNNVKSRTASCIVSCIR